MAWHPLFMDVYDRWFSLLRQAARMLCPVYAEDIASEVVRILIQKWKAKPTPRFRAFLDAVAENARAGLLHVACRRELRKLARRRRYQTHGLVDLSHFAKAVKSTDSAREVDTADLIEHFLQGATCEEQFLVACLQQGKSMDEAAGNLRRPLRTVYAWRDRLRQRAVRSGLLDGSVVS